MADTIKINNKRPKSIAGVNKIVFGESGIKCGSFLNQYSGFTLSLPTGIHSNTITIKWDSSKRGVYKIIPLSIELNAFIPNLELEIEHFPIRELHINHKVKNLKITNASIEELFINKKVENLEINFGSSSHIKNIKITDATLCFSNGFTFMNSKDKAKIENISLESGAEIYNYPVGVNDYPSNSLMVTKHSGVYPWKEIDERGIKKEIDFDGNFHKNLKQFNFDDGESELLSLRRLYQMLKRQANDRQDYIQAWFFYSRELKSHRMVLSWKKPNGKPSRIILWFKRLIEVLSWRKSKSKSHIRNDKVILWFNRVTNDFGLSWKRPFYWLLGINGIITLILFFALSSNDFSFLMFLQLFDIVWGAQEVFNGECGLEKCNLEKCSLEKCRFIGILSYAHRIVSAYLYYSMIIAFRRFSRKP